MGAFYEEGVESTILVLRERSSVWIVSTGKKEPTNYPIVERIYWFDTSSDAIVLKRKFLRQKEWEVVTEETDQDYSIVLKKAKDSLDTFPLKD